MSYRIFGVFATCLLAVPLAMAANDFRSEPVDFAEHLKGKRILFVGAHPDDEVEFAPMLAEACLFNGATCHFVTAAEANSPGCDLAGGVADHAKCSDIRREEMRKSAAMLGGEVTFFGWDDLFYAHNSSGLERNLAKWAADNGGRKAMVRSMHDVVADFGPEIVLTLDPRSGNSCHPNHRAVAHILFEALDQLPEGERPEVWLEGDFWIGARLSGELSEIFANSGVIPWPGVDWPVHWYDANKLLPNGHPAWDYLVEVQRIHKTQYPALADGRPAQPVPAEFKRIPFINAADIDISDELCDPLQLKFFTDDLFGAAAAQ